MSNKPLFTQFLQEVEQSELATNITTTGITTIQQSLRNGLRRQGVKALLEDLLAVYGDHFDIVETKDGIVIVAYNEPGDFNVSWEIKCTIKSTDYDPFLEAQIFEDAEEEKARKKAAREADKIRREEEIAAKRAKKLAEMQARQSQ